MEHDDMSAQHTHLADGGWFQLTLAEQLGNIGSEVGRAASWKQKGNQEYFEKATTRMLELVDLTLADSRWTGSRQREIARVREALCDSFFGEQTMGGTMESWNGYFMPFATMARRER